MKQDQPDQPPLHARRGPGRPRKHPKIEEQVKPPQPTIDPRLFDLAQTARYLSVSPWTVRDLESSGILHRIRIPLPGRQELRKLLFDREELDRLIEVWKDRI